MTALQIILVGVSLVYYIFHDDMLLKPYKFHLWYKLEDKDYEKRLNESPIGSLNSPSQPINAIMMQWWGIFLFNVACEQSK